MAKVTKVSVGEVAGRRWERSRSYRPVDRSARQRGRDSVLQQPDQQQGRVHRLLAVIAPNLPTKPNTVMFNKVTIKGAKQAVQMFGPAQYAVAKAVADSVAEGVIPAAEADDLFICVGVFIHWEANDDKKIQDYNYRATKEAMARAVNGEPKAAGVSSRRRTLPSTRSALRKETTARRTTHLLSTVALLRRLAAMFGFK